MTYIGITGKSNKYRTLVGWLVGSILDDMQRFPGKDLMETHKGCIEELKERGFSAVGSSDRVVLESFGHYILDHTELFVGGSHIINKELSNYIIDLNDFSIHAKKMDEDLNSTPHRITFKDFTIRFGECLKKEFGSDVWVKSTDSWVRYRDDECEYVFYTDVKTEEELNHILSHNGVMIHVSSPFDKREEKEYNKIKNNTFSHHNISVPFPWDAPEVNERFYYNLLQLAVIIYKTKENDKHTDQSTY